MKMKNANFIEKHVEKVILGLGALIALVVVWFYVIGNPYGIAVGSKQIAPDQIEDSVRQPVRDLQRRLVAAEVPEELKISVRGYTDQFVNRDQGGAAPDAWNIPLGARIGLASSVFEGSKTTVVEYAEAVPPAPFEVLGRSGLHVLRQHEHLAAIYARNAPLMDEAEAAGGARKNGQLIADRYVELVAKGRPRDFESVTVMASFDWEAWEKELQKRQARKPIPEHWWRGPAVLTDVILERQVLDPRSGLWGAVLDGKFQAGKVKRVDALPGNLSFRKPPENLAGADLTNFIEDANVQDLIIRAPFPPIEDVWLAPDEQQKQRNADQELELLRLNKRIADRENRMIKLDEQAERQAEKEQLASDREALKREAREQSRRVRDDDGLDDDSTRKRKKSGRSTARRDRMRPGPTDRQGPRRGGGFDPRGGMNARMTSSQTTQEQQQDLQMELEKLYERRAILLGLIEEEPSEDEEGGSDANAGPRNRSGGAFGPGQGRYRQGGRFGGQGPSVLQRRPMPTDRSVGGFGPRARAPMQFGRNVGRNFGPNDRPGLRSNVGRRNMGRHGGGRGVGNMRRPGANFNPLDFEEEAIEPIIVWAHDLSAEPGRTYQYRLRVSVPNPFYLRNRVVDSQKPLTKHHALESKPSQWTDPISTYRKTYFYLVSNSRKDDEGVVEVFRQFNGGWRRREFSVRAGEPIGGVFDVKTFDLESKIDLDVGAIVVDVDPTAPSMVGAGRSTTRMLYLDLKTNQLMERTVERDEKDERRVYLHNQARLAAMQTEMARSGF